jgi:RND family efflux transporter MFP subunit
VSISKCVWCVPLFSVLSLIQPGCQPAGTVAPGSMIPEVTVAAPVSRELVDYERFTGRIAPGQQIDLRARVSGYLVKVHFQPGAEVAKDELLVEIDPVPFENDLSRTTAAVAQAQAKLTRLESTFKRIEAARAKGASTEEEFQTAAGETAEAEASLSVAKADQKTAEINLGYCQLKAPIAGKIGDRLMDEGNFVTGGPSGAFNSTLLSTIVSVDPVSVVFDLDENTLLRLQQAIRDGKLESPVENVIPVEVGLPIHRQDYPLKGIVQFINNQVDSKTGTILIKADVPNPKPETGARVMTPGMFARVRIPLGRPRTALMVPEAALGSDQGSRFLFVVNAEKKAVRITAEVGLLEGDLREIVSVRASGDAESRQLKSDETVIVRGIQRVRSGIEVAAIVAEP